MSPIDIVGLVAGVAVIVELAPQPWKIRRTGSLDGVSAVGSGIALANEAGWLLYGLMGGFAPIVVTSLVAGSLKVWQFALVRPHWSAHNLRLVAGWVTAVVAGAVTGTLGVVLVVGLLAGLGPQALAVVRSADISGVSAWRWRLALVSGVLWVGYGLMSGASATAATGTAGVMLSLLALWRITATTGSVRSTVEQCCHPLDVTFGLHAAVSNGGTHGRGVHQVDARGQAGVGCNHGGARPLKPVKFVGEGAGTLGGPGGVTTPEQAEYQRPFGT